MNNLSFTLSASQPKNLRLQDAISSLENRKLQDVFSCFVSQPEIEYRAIIVTAIS